MKYLSYGVMVYMLLALVWWTVLLSKNNELLFNKNLEIHKIQIQNIAGLSDQEKVTYNSLKDEYRTKKHKRLITKRLKTIKSKRTFYSPSPMN